MSDTYTCFYALWGENYHSPVKFTPGKLAAVEGKLGFLFPQSYVRAIGTCGAFSTRAVLLDTIVDRNLNMRDINEFLEPTEIGEVMLGWREAGMPEGLVPFAKDCMGNFFCFNKEDGQAVRKADCPIYSWDHDFNAVDLEASSFEAWIGRYLSLSASL
jgi:SMI1-KNR4 cell-wall